MDLEYRVDMGRDWLKQMYKLSNAELDVVAKLSNGWQSSQIAEALCVTEKTIKFHLTSIYKKLDVKNRTAAVLKLQDSL